MSELKKTRILASALLATMVVGVFASLTAQAPAGGRTHPLPASNFLVEIDGITASSFSEVSGLSCETTVVEYRDGSDPNRIRLLPGETRCGPVTLKRGLTEDTELFDWFQSVVDGDDTRRSMSVIFLERSGAEVTRVNLHQCFLTSWSILPLDAVGGGAAIEQIVVSCETLEFGR